jgi:hypothetical protein
VDAVWMKPKLTPVLSSTPKSMALQTVRPMRAAAGYHHTDCGEKRDPRSDATNRMTQNVELDINARLEKLSFVMICFNVRFELHRRCSERC